MSSIVLDASAVLAVAHNERGAEAVRAARSNAVLSAINHMEVVSKLLQFALPVEEIDRFLSEVFPNVVPLDREQADSAGRLHARTRSEGLSYADCACLTLAALRGLPVLTGVRKWETLSLPVEIRLFR
ncbi:MAG: type II toxin-antitoxin system VapC family toxin [Planctomycetaceae bacterium]|nr:type II toxin-antitoxin system VapC family toxin [Planctomycetaceae bacterium]